MMLPRMWRCPPADDARRERFIALAFNRSFGWPQRWGLFRLKPWRSPSRSNSSTARGSNCRSHNVVGRNTAYGAFSTQLRTDGQLQIGVNSLSGSMTRTVLKNGRAVGSASRSFYAILGQSNEAGSGGSLLWWHKRNALTLVRTYTAGGPRMVLSFSDDDGHLTCSVSTQVHDGGFRTASIFGGEVVVSRMKQTSSTCSVSGVPSSLTPP